MLRRNERVEKSRVPDIKGQPEASLLPTSQELAIGHILRPEIDFPQLSAAFGLVSKGFRWKNMRKLFFETGAVRISKFVPSKFAPFERLKFNSLQPEEGEGSHMCIFVDSQ